MTLRRPKCDHCPNGLLDGPCIGQNNRRACELADPASEHHRPGYKPPGLVVQAASLVESAAVHLAAGAPSAGPEAKAARLAICRGCEFFGDGRCLSCGCYLDAKAGWAGERCPLDPPKWGPVEPE